SYCEEQPIAFCYYCKSRHNSIHRVIKYRRGMRKDIETPNLCDNDPNHAKTEYVTGTGNTDSSARSKQDNPGDNNEEESPAKWVARRHPRKGIPQCAPLF
ncbi:hypothetical protein EJB05_13432, partial [Eragrostis curvula]